MALFPAGCGATVGTQCKAYMSGATQSTIAQGFPGTANRFQSDLRATGGKSNATFIVVHEDGQSLDYATHYGGSGNGTNADAGIAVAVDANGDGYITGATFSNDLTLVNAAFSTYEGGGNTPPTSNAFVAQFDPTKSGAPSLIYATLLGGHGASGTIIITFLSANRLLDGRRPRHRNCRRSEFRHLGDRCNRLDRFSKDPWQCGDFVPGVQRGGKPARLHSPRCESAGHRRFRRAARSGSSNYTRTRFVIRRILADAESRWLRRADLGRVARIRRSGYRYPGDRQRRLPVGGDDQRYQCGA